MDITSKVFMFTGALSIPRWKAQQRVESAGGIAGSSVTGSTNYLVVGGAPGSKLFRAQELGIEILSEEEFFTLVPTEPVKSKAPPKGGQDLLPRWIQSYSDPEMLRLVLKDLQKVPDKLDYFKEIKILLGPRQCPVCQTPIPYTIGGDTWWCFNCHKTSMIVLNCPRYSHYFTTTKEEFPGVFQRNCRLCGTVIFVSSGDIDRIEETDLLEDHWHSVEFVLYLTDSYKIPVKTDASQQYTPEELDVLYTQFTLRMKRAHRIPS